MRNHFRKPKKCELRHSVFLKQTILCKQICERSEYICLQTYMNSYIGSTDYSIGIKCAERKQQAFCADDVCMVDKQACTTAVVLSEKPFIGIFVNPTFPDHLGECDHIGRLNVKAENIKVLLYMLGRNRPCERNKAVLQAPAYA